MLYCISDHPSNRYRYAVMDYGYYSTDSYVCGSCGRPVRKCQLAYWPPRMWLEGGKRYPDYLSVSVPFEDRCGMIVSERALAAFQREKITGFDASPIALCDGREGNGAVEGMPRYYYLTVHGSVALDYGTMHYRKKNVCPDCGSFRWSRERIGASALDWSSWNQCDICKLVDYPNIILCTQKVIDVVRANNLKGFTMRGETEIFLPLKVVKVC